jgi:hypothetical protein
MKETECRNQKLYCAKCSLQMNREKTKVNAAKRAALKKHNSYLWLK